MVAADMISEPPRFYPLGQLEEKKPVRFEIMSKLVLERTLTDWFSAPVEPFVVISIASPGQAHPRLQHLHLLEVLPLVFHDVDQPVSYLPANTLFQPQQAEQILDLLERHRQQVKLFICQCEAGISRSAAVAAALSLLVNGSDEHIWNDRRYLPNRLVYRLILDAAGQHLGCCPTS